MSKTKSTKKKAKITKAELEELQTLNQNLAKLNNSLASIEIAKYDTLKDVDVLRTKFATLRDTLEEKYGKVSISIEDGSIQEIPDESKD